jgi:hypothetical protein
MDMGAKQFFSYMETWMLRFEKNKWFQKVVVGITCLFFGMLILVTVVAYSRPSGSTGLDMAKVQMMRYENSSAEIEKSL